MIPEPIFSIIVPVYNVEPYIKHCLESIMNQTLQDIEVIVVYDPSTTDESFNICQSIILKCTNFSLHYSKNSGAGAVRNYGLDQASGKFICYVDGDDWIEPNLCSDMLLVLEDSDADFVNFGFEFVNIDMKVLVTKGKFKQELLRGNDIFRKAMLDDDIFTVIWNKVYRHSFLIENKIRFPEVKLWEDILYTRKVAYFSQKTFFVSKVYYHALVRYNSNSRIISSGYLSDGLLLLRREYEFILSMPEGRKFENLFRAHFIKHISFYLVKAAFQVKSLHEYISCFQLIGNSEYRIYISQSEVKALLLPKNRFMIFICNYPRILRMISSILKKVGVSPY